MGISQKLDVLNKAGLSKDNFMDKDSGENIKQVKGKITSHFTPSPAASKAHATKDAEGAKESKECLRVNLERELEGISWEDSDFDEESLAQVERGNGVETLNSEQPQAGMEKSTVGSPVTEPGADSTFDTFDDHQLALLDSCDEQPSSKKTRI